MLVTWPNPMGASLPMQTMSANFKAVEAREDVRLAAAAVEPLGGPEFRTNGVLAPWHNL